MKKRYWLLLAVGALVCFIWGNSMLSGEVSGEISSGLLYWLINTFPFLKWLPHYVLRKIGHFSEFALLGFLLSWYFLLQGQKGIHRITVPFLLALLVANADETIQTITPDRGPSLIDVWIDSAGFCTGIAVLFLVYAVMQFVKRKKGIQNEKTDKPVSSADSGTDPFCRL